MAFQLARGAVVAGRYRLEREIGEGGMGTVWAATELRTKRPVAVKVIRASSHSPAELRRRFVREARAASAVVHPHLVEVLDAFDLREETPVLVMELLEGETLASLLEREERLPLARCADLLVPALSAVGTVHARGIVHRDLKPANIFLARNASGETTVKVLDFGIAKLFLAEGEAGFTQSTRTGSTLGTPAYMAPEQATGQRDVDHLADVWAFGVILYECLSGIRPIEGDTVGQVVMSLMSTGITPVDRLVPDLPEEVARLVRRMLSRERTLRPKNLEEPFQLLCGYTARRPPAFGAPVSERIEAQESLAPRLAAGESGAAPARGSGRRGRTATFAAGFGVVAMAAALLVGRSRAGSASRVSEAQGRVSTITSPARGEPRAPSPLARAASAINARSPAPLPLATAAAPPSGAPLQRRERAHLARPAAPDNAPLPAPVPVSPTASTDDASAPPRATVQPPPSASGTPRAEFNGGLAEEVPF